MPFQLKIALLVSLIVYLIIVSISVKHKTMRINYLIFWSFVGALMLVALFIPGLIRNIATFLGFEAPVNMLLVGSIFMILFLIHDLTRVITKEHNKNVLLIQEISLLKDRIEKLENKDK